MDSKGTTLVLESTKEQDNKNITEIKKILLTYPLALYKDDMINKNWDDPEAIIKAGLDAIKLAIWDLRTNETIAKCKIDFNQIKVSGEYILNLKINKLKLYVCYNQSDKETIELYIWNKVNIAELIAKLNEEIKNKIISKQYVESNWNDNNFIIALAKKYEFTLAKKIAKKVLINNQDVIINWDYISFRGYEKNTLINSTITLKYDYLNISDQTLNLEIKLINKPKIIDYTNQIINFLQKTKLFDNINIDINWQDPEKYQKHIDNIKNKLEMQIGIISRQLNLFDIDNLTLPNWKIQVNKVATLGPLENKLTIYFSINNSKNLIPFTFNFVNNLKEKDIEQLEKYLNEKLKTIFIKKDSINVFRNETWLQLIKLKIKNKILWNNNEVPFDCDQLIIHSSKLDNNQQKLFLKLIQHPKQMVVNIKLI